MQRIIAKLNNAWISKEKWDGPDGKLASAIHDDEHKNVIVIYADESWDAWSEIDIEFVPTANWTHAQSQIMAFCRTTRTKRTHGWTATPISGEVVGG